MKYIKIGSMFPDFSLPDQDEVTRKLSDYRGKRVILKLPIIMINGNRNSEYHNTTKAKYLFKD